MAGLLALLGVAVWIAGHRKPTLTVAKALPTPPVRVVPLPDSVVAERMPAAIDDELIDQLSIVTVAVIDAETKRPVPDAWVVLPVPSCGPREGATIETEVQAFASNPVVLPMHWCLLTVVAGAEGYEPALAHAQVMPDAPEPNLTIELVRAGGVEVRIREAERGAPVDGVVMVARPDGLDTDLRTFLNFMAPNFLQKGDPAPRRSIAFPLPPARRPASGAESMGAATMNDAVELFRSFHAPGFLDTTLDPLWSVRYGTTFDGKVVFDRMPPGAQWTVVVWPDGPYEHARVDGITCTAGGAATVVEVEVRAVNRITGHVRFDDGSPVKGAFLQVYTEDKVASETTDTSAIHLFTDEDGAFVVPVNRSRLLVLASLDRGRDGRKGIAFGDFAWLDLPASTGIERALELTLSERKVDSEGHPDWIRGRVLHKDGRPAAGVQVDGGFYGARVFTDVDGTFRIHGGIGALKYVCADIDRDQRALTEVHELMAYWVDADGESHRASRSFTVGDLAAEPSFELRFE